MSTLANNNNYYYPCRHVEPNQVITQNTVIVLVEDPCYIDSQSE